MDEISPSLFNFFNTQSFKSMLRVKKVKKNRKENGLPPQTKASRNAHGQNYWNVCRQLTVCILWGKAGANYQLQLLQYMYVLCPIIYLLSFRTALCLLFKLRGGVSMGRFVCLSVCLSVEKMKSAEFGLTVCGKQSGKFLRSLNLFLNPGAEFLWVGLPFCRSVRKWRKIKIRISTNCLNETTKVSSNETSFKGFQVIIIISATSREIWI